MRYIGDVRYLGSRRRRIVRTVLGYDEKKHAIFCSELLKKGQRYSFEQVIVGTSTKWYQLGKNHRWGGVRPDPPPPPAPFVQRTPLEDLQILYPVDSTIESGFDFPDLPHKAGETKKQ